MPMILNEADLTHLDAGLDPKDYPERLAAWKGELHPDNLLDEEMAEFGIEDESEITSENYLKARRQYVAGQLTSFGQVIKLAKQLTAEERRDISPDWVDVVDEDELAEVSDVVDGVEWHEDEDG